MSNSTLKYSLATNSIGLPVQAVSSKVKQTPEWQESCMNFFESMATYQTPDKLIDLKKYRLVNGEFDFKDYEFVTDPLSLGMMKEEMYGSTDQITHYPIISRPINAIVGERIKRPVNFLVVSESAHSKNEYFRVKTDLLRNYVIQTIQQRIQQSLMQQGVKPDAEDFEQQIQAMMPEEIQDYMVKDYIDVVEQVANRILKNYWKKQSLENEFVEGFKRVVITAKEFYHTYCIGGKNVYTENITDQEIFYHKSPSVKWIAEGQYAGFVKWLTPSSIIDKYSSSLKAKDVKRLEEMVSPHAEMGSRTNNRVGISSIQYKTDYYKDWTGATHDHIGADFSLEGMLTDYYQTGGMSSGYLTQFGLTKVVKAYWKSLRKIGFLTYYDENDEEQEMIVSDEYIADISKGEYIEWRYINELWEGTKIGEDIFIDVRRCPYQIVDMDQPEYCPLPIDGCTYNDTSAKPTSLVDLMKPWQELYNIVAYELKKDLTAGIGHVMFMSIDHIPDIPGFSKEKWYYWAKELKIAWVQQSKKSNYNQFSSQDMSFAKDIEAKMNLLERIKQECQQIVGFNEGRLGNATEESTASQSQQSLVTSVNQTEYLFFKHFQLIQRVLSYALNLSKQTIKNNNTMRNLFSDMEQQYLDFDADQVINANLGVYLSNTSDDLRKKEGLGQLLQAAAQNGADLVDMADLYLSDTVSETRNILAKLRKKTAERAQADQQAQQSQIDQQAQIAKLHEDREDERNKAKLENNLEVSYIRTFGGKNASPGDDINSDAIPDIVQYEELAIKQEAHVADIENKKRDTDLKEKDMLIKAKLKMEDQKLEEKNMQNDIEVAKINAKNRASKTSK